MAQYLHPARRATLLRDLSSLALFLSCHPDYPVSVRLHPLDRGETRRYLEARAPHVRWLEAEVPLPQVVDEFDIVLGSFSAGLIDAAARGKPVIAFSSSGLAEALGLQDVGLPVVDGHEALSVAVKEVVDDYERASRAALSLAGQHYQHLDDATERIVDLLHALVEGRDISASRLPIRELPHRMDRRGPVTRMG
jgi:glycosyltransferase involved in cell wall biosynthesis